MYKLCSVRFLFQLLVVLSEFQICDACGIIAPQRTFISIRVLQGLRKKPEYFHATIQALSEIMKNDKKAWIGDFTIQTNTEAKLLVYLKTLSNIRKKHKLCPSAVKPVFHMKRVESCR